MRLAAAAAAAAASTTGRLKKSTTRRRHMRNTRNMRAKVVAEAETLGGGAPTGEAQRKRRLLALDFDGVIGDTAGESAVAAVRCLERTFAPDLLRELEEEVSSGEAEEASTTVRSWLVENVERARPAVCTGYENLLMMMVLARSLQLGIRGCGEYDSEGRVSIAASVEGNKDGIGRIAVPLPSDGVDLMRRWGTEGSGGLCDLALHGTGIVEGGTGDAGLYIDKKFFNMGMSREELVQLFGTTRDDMIKDDQEAWVGANRLYDGVADALRAALKTPIAADGSTETDIWIVTTKQARFARLLMSKLGGVEVPENKCVSLTESGRAKAEVLYEIQSGITPMEVAYAKKRDGGGDNISSSSRVMPEYHEKIFVEDRLGALERVLHDDRLDDWRLLLVDYGYNTEEERRACGTHERMEVIGLKNFCRLLKG